MNASKNDGRKLIQVTMRPELHDQVKERCDELDLPVTVWIRELIKQALARPEP